MDITGNITKFREAVRHLWNTYFMEKALRNTDWDLRDEFSNIYVDLFNVLVKYDLPECAPSIPHLWNGDNNVQPAPGPRRAWLGPVTPEFRD